MRDIPDPGFAGDTGAADPALESALTAYASGEPYADALIALSTSRVLVPVVAVLGEVEVDDVGLTHDKSSDMAAVLVEGGDGRLALLAFSSTVAMAAWDSSARPVPVPVATAAQAALQEDAAALVLDLSGPVTLVVEGEDLRALAAGWTLTRVEDTLGWLQP